MIEPLPGSGLKVWLPAIRAGSGSDVFVERLAKALEAKGVGVTVTWFPHWLELFPDLLRLVKPPAGTNIIHVNAAQAFAFKRAGIPLIATELHYILDPAFRPFKSWAQHMYHRLLIGRYLHRSFAAADAITAISEFTATVIRDSGHAQGVLPIPLWVDLKTFVPCGRRPPDGRFRLFFVGNASKRKGADVIPLLAERLGPAFEIVCTAGLRQQMNDKLPANVRVVGKLSESDMVLQYQHCDAVLVPSRYEGFGYAALEGMACAKPVVGFRSGAVAEVVGELNAGLLADIDDIDNLARSCLMLAADPALAAEFGSRGRVRAETAFSEDAGILPYIKLYKALV